jgi:uncharacterized membrane protein YjjB (DUF3815 family)
VAATAEFDHQQFDRLATACHGKMTDSKKLAVQPVSSAAIDMSRLVAGLTLACIVVSAFLLRYRVWLLDGGLEPDYLTWANVAHFGFLANRYLHAAGQIFNGHWDVYYPPGYPAFLALVRAAGVHDPQQIRLVQGFVDASACILCYQVLRGLGLLRVSALAGAALYGVLPWLMKGGTRIMAESLLPFLMLLLLVSAIRARRHQRAWDWILMGIAGVTMALVRPELTLLLPPLAAGAFMLASSGNRLRASLWAAIGFLTPWFALAATNFHLHDSFFISKNSIFYYGLVCGLGQLPNDFGYFLSDDRAVNLIRSMGMQFYSREAEAYWRQVYIEAWLQHPAHVLRTTLHRVHMIMLEPADAAPFAGSILLYRWGPYSLAGAVIGCLFRRRPRDIVIIVFPVAAAIATIGWYYVELRYIRYASLSYVLACGVALDAVLIGLLAVIRRRAVPVAASFKAAVAAAALTALFLLVPGLRAFDLAARSVVDRSPSDKLPDQTFRPLSNWIAVVPGVTVERGDDEVISVTTSSEVRGYQAMATIADTAQYQTVSLIYEIEVVGKDGYVGVLQGDHKAWRWFLPLNPNGATRSHITVPIHDSVLSVMLQTGADKKEPERFRVLALRYALSCIDSPSTLGRVFQTAFPYPGSLQFVNCK